jgi:hypothetical protein
VVTGNTLLGSTTVTAASAGGAAIAVTNTATQSSGELVSITGETGQTALKVVTGNTVLDATTITALTCPAFSSAAALDLNAASGSAISFSIDGTEKARVHSDGNVGVGTASPGVLLDVAGQARGTAAFISTSDRRFKKNVLQLQGSLDKVMNLTGVSYDWRMDEFPERKFSAQAQVGFIAQDVENVVPELVHTDPDGWKSIAYATLTPVIVEAMKSQQHQIEELAQQSAKQQDQIDQQQLQIAELMNLLKQQVR